MANPATRLITLIMLLQRQPNQTAAQLAQALDVSPRTVQRYIAMLDEMGIPVYGERGPGGGYALVRGYKLPPLVFTPEEAVALFLGASMLEQVWGRLYQAAARGALAKLDNLLPDEQRREVAWAQSALRTVTASWADPGEALPSLELLRDAIRQRRRVRMRYRGTGQPALTEREVDPYTLVHSWGWHYCIGYCHLRQAIRSFRLDRMSDVAVLGQSFAEDVDFDLQAYIKADPWFQGTVRAQLRFGPEAAQFALDYRAIWKQYEEQPDGAVLVSFTAPDLEAAVGIVLRYGYLATIEEPAELRRRVQERANALAVHFAAAG